MRLRTIGLATAVAGVATLTLTGAASADTDDDHPLPPGAVVYVCEDGHARRIDPDELDRFRAAMPVPPGRPGRVEFHDRAGPDGAEPVGPGAGGRFEVHEGDPGSPRLNETFEAPTAPGVTERRVVIIGSGEGGVAPDPDEACAAPERLPSPPRPR